MIKFLPKEKTRQRNEEPLNHDSNEASFKRTKAKRFIKTMFDLFLKHENNKTKSMTKIVRIQLYCEKNFLC